MSVLNRGSLVVSLSELARAEIGTFGEPAKRAFLEGVADLRVPRAGDTGGSAIGSWPGDDKHGQ